MIGQRLQNFKLKYIKDFFFNEGGESLAQVIHIGGKCSNPGNMQDGAGWGSEQSSLMEVVPAYDNKVGGPFQYKQSYNFPFYFCS